MIEFKIQDYVDQVKSVNVFPRPASISPPTSTQDPRPTVSHAQQGLQYYAWLIGIIAAGSAVDLKAEEYTHPDRVAAHAIAVADEVCRQLAVKIYMAKHPNPPEAKQ